MPTDKFKKLETLPTLILLDNVKKSALVYKKLLMEDFGPTYAYNTEHDYGHRINVQPTITNPALGEVIFAGKNCYEMDVDFSVRGDDLDYIHTSEKFGAGDIRKTYKWFGETIHEVLDSLFGDNLVTFAYRPDDLDRRIKELELQQEN